MRLLVCGGRDFCDTKKLYKTLDTVNKEMGIDVLIEGDARGADRIAGYWARKNKIHNLKFPADWSLGKRAGPKRNQQMLEESLPDICIAFPTVNSRGTYDMIRRAEKAGVEVIIIE